MCLRNSSGVILEKISPLPWSIISISLTSILVNSDLAPGVGNDALGIIAADAKGENEKVFYPISGWYLLNNTNG